MTPETQQPQQKKADPEITDVFKLGDRLISEAQEVTPPAPVEDTDGESISDN